MNDELKSMLVKVGLMGLTMLATRLHLSPELSSLYPAVAADLADLVMFGYALYLNRGMKKVPVEASVHVDGITVSKPGETKAAIAPLILLALLVGTLALPPPAHAQTVTGRPRIQLPIDPLGLNDKLGTPATPSATLDALVAKLRALSLADFQYAAALAKATGNQITQPCWDAWVKLLQAQQQVLNGPDGQPLPTPEPHIITDVERLSELIHQLQPDSDISRGCAPMALAAQKDIGNLIGAVMSGGALGLLKLPFAIP